MAKDLQKGISPFQDGFLHEVMMQLRLVLRLMSDNRVNPFLKLLPILSGVYLIVPLDLAPVFPLDDAAIVLLGLYMFVELCPPDVVEEHLRELNEFVFGEINDPPVSEDIIEADFEDIDQT